MLSLFTGETGSTAALPAAATSLSRLGRAAASAAAAGDVERDEQDVASREGAHLPEGEQSLAAEMPGEAADLVAATRAKVHFYSQHFMNSTMRLFFDRRPLVALFLNSASSKKS